MFLAEIVVHRPVDVLRGFRRESKQLVFEPIGGFDLVGAIHYPIVQAESIVHWKAGAHAHVIERQEAEPERTRVVHLILGVVPLDSQRTSPLAEINRQAFAQRSDIGAVSLENIAVDSAAAAHSKDCLAECR